MPIEVPWSLRSLFVQPILDSITSLNDNSYFLYLADSFDMGFDIQHYYSLHQNLTLEDLAKASSRHTLKGLVKVINKVSLSPNRYLFSNFKPPQGFQLHKNLCNFWILISIPIICTKSMEVTWEKSKYYVNCPQCQLRGLGGLNWINLDARISWMIFSKLVYII